MNIKENLTKLLNESATTPVLFIGSGFSRRYLGTKNWEKLLEHFSTSLNQSFNLYTSKVKNNNLPKVASIMAEEFHDIWWT